MLPVQELADPDDMTDHAADEDDLVFSNSGKIKSSSKKKPMQAEFDKDFVI